MPMFRVMGELTQMFELEVEAANYNEALEIAQDSDIGEWHVWDTTGMTDGFEIIKNSVEEIE